MSHRLENRELIIRAAESMFALEGVHSVSLRAINSAAGQRNNASLHYYFGKRVNLIEAVLEARSAAIRDGRIRRSGELAAEHLPATERHHTVSAHLDALVGPLAHLLEDVPGGCHFLMIVQQLIRDPRDYPHPVPGRGDFDTEPELIAGLVGALDNLPPHLARLRVHQALLAASHALGQRAQDILERLDDETAAELQMSNSAFVANLSDMLLGGLLAPASRAALEQRAP